MSSARAARRTCLAFLSLLTKPETKKRSWRVDFKACDVHRLMVSFWSCISYVGLGASLVVFGPTILDLGEQLDVSVGILSIMLGCRAVGAALGSLSSGLAVDRLVNHSYIFMSFIVIFCLAMTVVVPLSVNIYLLAVFMFLNGVATGGLDSGTHAVLMRLWKDESGPCMQVLHFAFGFGAFLAPLIAKQFISAEQDDEAGNSTSYSGSGWAEGNCTAMMQCAMNSTAQEGDFRIAYWITSSFFLPPFVAYVFYSVRYDILRHFTRKTRSVTSDSTNTAVINHAVEDEELVEQDQKEQEDVEFQVKANGIGEEDANKDCEANSNTTSSDSTKKRKRPLWFVITILLLMGTFMFFYVGLEAGYGSWIFTVAVTGTLDFSKRQGTVIQSLYWGTFAFTRLFSVVLALLNVKASVMMTGNLTGSVIASIIMVSLPHNAPAIWLASAVLGMSYASIFPTTMTWMSETVEATGKAASILVTGGILGDITLPAVTGALIAQVTPDSLFYLTFVGIFVCAGLVALMFTLTYFQNRRQARASQAAKLELARTSSTDEQLSEEEEQLISNEESTMLEQENATLL